MNLDSMFPQRGTDNVEVLMRYITELKNQLATLDIDAKIKDAIDKHEQTRHAGG